MSVMIEEIARENLRHRGTETIGSCRFRRPEAEPENDGWEEDGEDEEREPDGDRAGAADGGADCLGSVLAEVLADRDGWRVLSVRRICGPHADGERHASCWRSDEDHLDVVRARAYLLNEEPGVALDLLVPLHRKAPTDQEVQALMLDALAALGKRREEFAWTVEPVVVGIDRDLLDHLAERLARCGRGSTVLDLHLVACDRGLTEFDPAELADALAADRRFAVERCRLSPETSMVFPLASCL